jgi:hypothetical protein
LSQEIFTRTLLKLKQAVVSQGAAMKRAVFALTMMLSIFSVAVALQNVEAQQTTQESGFPFFSEISITSPHNTTYRDDLLTLNITSLTLFKPSTVNITIVYSVDGKANVTIPVEEIPEVQLVTVTYANGTTETVQGEPPFVPARIGGWVTLPQLPEGTHHITVYARMEYNNGDRDFIGLDSNTVYFTIDDGAPPIISVLSLENKTYSRKDLALNFTVDEPTSWMGYCLDGQANVTVAENFTLTELPSGSHTLTFYANDTVGNMGASETINFSIATPFPTTVVATASIVTVACITAVLLVYFKKRKQ